MKIVKYLLFFLLFPLYSYCQSSIFEKFNFDKGEYYIVGIRSTSDRSSLADSMGEFYTKDISVLNSFKLEWVFNKPSPFYLCGYHYIIAVCKNGEAVETFNVNLNCNEIVTDKGSFFFDAQKLRIFANKVQKVIVLNKDFGSLIEGRTYRDSILKEKKMLFVYKPAWTDYEGEFSFRYPCTKPGDCFDDEELTLKHVYKKICKVYPHEKFNLYSLGGASEGLHVAIRCNKSLADVFQIYPIGWNKWEAYYVTLKSYWIK